MASAVMCKYLLNIAIRNPKCYAFCSPAKYTILSHRTTYILKRETEPKLVSMDSLDEPVESSEAEQIYEIVENTNKRPQGTLDLILTEFVEDIGKRGQRVTVKEHYGYTKLLLTKCAVYATDENIAKHRLLSADDDEKHSTVTAFKTWKLLKNKVLSVFMNMDGQWTVEKWHIRASFRKDGVYIHDDECIELPENPITGPDLSLEGKDFVIFVTINNLERTPVRCRLRHWTLRYSDRLPLAPDHDRTPSQPIFQQEAELLDTLPLPAEPSAHVMEAHSVFKSHTSRKKKLRKRKRRK